MLGWSLYASLNTLMFVQWGGASESALSNGLFLGMSGLVVSHGFRLTIKSLKYSGRYSLSAAIAALLFAGGVWELSLISFHVYVVKLYTLDNISVVGTIFYYLYYLSILIIWFLFYSNIKTSAAKKQTELDALKLALSLKEAQLENLKWQMNPHFLFNSLNSIRALISENPDNAKEMVTKLSVLLRYALNSPDKSLVKVKEEFNFIENYLALEKTRFEERLEYTVDLPKQLEELEVPSLLIHTLVENGIKHGIAKIPDGGRIELKAEKNKQTLSISILSSGVLQAPHVDGTGLRNSRERLKLAFGQRASLELHQLGDKLVQTQLNIEL